MTIHYVPRLPLPYCFSVRMSALALLKMAMHARSGGDLEVSCVCYPQKQQGAARFWPTLCLKIAAVSLFCTSSDALHLPADVDHGHAPRQDHP